MINWKHLTSIEDLNQALEASKEQPVALFKHSTRCSVSLMAKKTLEYGWDLPIDAYFLDLITHRNVSNAIAQQLNVEHQSPQLIVVKNGEAIHSASHGSINAEDVAAIV